MASKWVRGAMVIALGAGLGAAAGTQQKAETSEAAIATRVEGDWELGPYVTDVSTTVGSAGGDVAVTSGELAGLRMEFPAGAAADGTTVTIEHAAILGQTWGSIIDPATPAIRVTVGDGSYLADAVNVSVPVVLAADEMAMGLFVGEGGELEGMPSAGGADSMVHLAARHMGDWFVSAFIPENMPAVIDSGFRAGVDNWQFVNQGSYVSVGGHCAGMSLTSMWYYTEQVKYGTGTAHLYGLFDYPHSMSRSPGHDSDDAHVIRWASVVQVEMAGYISPEPFRWLRDAGLDPWQFQVFRYSMLVTGEPQLVTLRSESGGSHAIVAFRADVGPITLPGGQQHQGGTLYVSDPNVPSAAGVIRYDATTSSFLPYQSALNADDTPKPFEHIGYAAKTAYVDWNGLTTSYAAMHDGTIGDGLFPRLAIYQLVTDPATGQARWALVDQPVADANGDVTVAMSITPSIPGQAVVVDVYEDGSTAMIGSTSVLISGALSEGRVVRSMLLHPGTTGHTYRLEIYAQRWFADSPAVKRWRWVDAVPLTIAPAGAPVTTTIPTATVPPSQPPAITVVPTEPPTTPSPVTVYDCSACPPGVLGLDCRLHCEQI